MTYQNNKKTGTATLKIIGDNHFYGTITLNFQITPAATPKPQTAKTFQDAYNIYTVNATGTSVALKRPRSRNTVTAKIPATVKANGKTYKVTAIAANAFKNCKNLKQVTISGNITSIGAGAFQGCTSLRTVKIGSRVSMIGTKGQGYQIVRIVPCISTPLMLYSIPLQKPAKTKVVQGLQGGHRL